MNLFAKDTFIGDTPLHVACKNRNVDIVKLIIDTSSRALLEQGKPADASKCLIQNFKGETSVLLATRVEDMRILTIFAEHKWEALQKRDYLGENPLFPCARNGNENIFMWYAGNNEFFKARGQQNFKGQTIEHIVCLHRKHAIVDEIKPRPDTKDYAGNLPVYYTLAENDVPMVEK